jgi:acyl carrier protein
VLKVERVGVDENFFDLGGDSLLLITMLSHLRKQVSPEIGVIDLFRYPKIRSLAAFLDQVRIPQPSVKDSLDLVTGARSPEERARKQRQAMQRGGKARAAGD